MEKAMQTVQNNYEWESLYLQTKFTIKMLILPMDHLITIIYTNTVATLNVIYNSIFFIFDLNCLTVLECWTSFSREIHF